MENRHRRPNTVDGQWVAFTRWDDIQHGALGSLWVINVDGTGEWLILDGVRQPKLRTWQEIHVLKADTLAGTGGTGRVRLTETPLRAIVEERINGEEPRSWNNVAPTWSPDGSQIACLTDRTGQWEIRVTQADGSDQHPLLPQEVQAQPNLQFNGVDELNSVVRAWPG